ncbi:MAG: hypothetical protein AAFX79_00675 [Planctomycetota bacterium]
MADETKESDAPAKEKPAKKGGLSAKVLAIIVAVMAVEGVGIFLFMTMMSGTPQDAEATELVNDENDPEALVEVLLTDEQFQNMTNNQVWIWEAELYLKVRRKNLEYVERELEQRQAEIREGVTQIFRRLSPTELSEADFRTGSRQLTALINDVFGTDADGLPRVDRLVIAKLRGFPRN